MVTKHRDGRKTRHDVVLPRRPSEDRLAAVSEAGREDRRQARGAHPELPDAAFAQTGPLQRRERGALRAGLGLLHAFHVADPPLSRTCWSTALLGAVVRRALPRRTANSISRACAEMNSRVRARRRRSRARTGRVEKSEVHGGPRGRRVPRADHQHNQVRLLRRTRETCSSRGWCRSTRCRATATATTRMSGASSANAPSVQFAIGERVQVRLDRIDGVERKLQFSVVVPAGSGKKKRRE